MPPARIPTSATSVSKSIMLVWLACMTGASSHSPTECRYRTACPLGGRSRGFWYRPLELLAELMHHGDRHTAFGNAVGHSLYRARPYIADGKDARHRRFDQEWIAV